MGEASKVDDTLDPRLACCPSEVLRSLSVVLLEVLIRPHRVNQVEGGLHTLEDLL